MSKGIKMSDKYVKLVEDAKQKSEELEEKRKFDKAHGKYDNLVDFEHKYKELDKEDHVEFDDDELNEEEQDDGQLDEKAMMDISGGKRKTKGGRIAKQTFKRLQTGGGLSKEKLAHKKKKFTDHNKSYLKKLVKEVGMPRVLQLVREVSKEVKDTEKDTKK
jgi:hypothetical protein